MNSAEDMVSITMRLAVSVFFITRESAGSQLSTVETASLPELEADWVFGSTSRTRMLLLALTTRCPP